MTSARVYLDASAAAKLLFLEAQAGALRDALAAAESVISSDLIELELTCAARRRRPATRERVAAIVRGIELVPLTPAIRERALGPWNPPQRALDAIHLATAVELDLDDLALLTYDVDQAKAGAAAGLRVLTPT